MTFVAKVLKVMIGSPGDVHGARQAALGVIHEWNAIHSQVRGQILLPLVWELNSAPAMGARAQEIINRQLTKDSDLLVATFWTRLGTPTGVAASGTVEEIEEHLRTGRPVMLYFSSEVPDSIVDETQTAALRHFKSWARTHGLVEEYESIAAFREKFARQLAITVNKKFPSVNASPTIESGSRRLSGDARELLAGVSDDARKLLAAAAKDPQGAILMAETNVGLVIDANRQTFVEDRSPSSEAKWRRVVRELVGAGLIEQPDPKGAILDVTDEGYRAADLIATGPDDAKKLRLLSLLHQTRLITHELPRERQKGEQIRKVTLWPDGDAALLRELGTTFGREAANLAAEAHRHLTVVADMAGAVQRTPVNRGFDWNHFDWERWVKELEATERTLVSLASKVDPNWAALV